MTCRQCGTEIAERALICYRCGAATVEAKYQPPPRGRGRRVGPMVVAGVLLALLLLLGLLAGGGW